VPTSSVVLNVRDAAKVVLFASSPAGGLDVDVAISVTGRISSVPEEDWPSNHVSTMSLMGMVAPGARGGFVFFPSLMPADPVGTKVISYVIALADVLVTEMSEL
jgi:hypothetical protein